MSVECPTCGDSFKNNRGMKCHHVQIHDESISGVEVDCENCDKTVRKEPYLVERCENNFCSQDCYHEWEISNEITEYSCDFCGEDVDKSPAALSREGNTFCDVDCHANWISENNTGEDHPLYNQVDVACPNCGKTNSIPESVAEKHDKNFCDQSCYSEWQSKNRVKENHPRWKGGYNQYYGENWHRERERALVNAEYICEECGMTNDEHNKKYNTDLNVHHIIPVREFDDPTSANYQDNLMVVCASCHNNIEGNHEKDEKALCN